MFLYIHLITEPFETTIPILAIKPLNITYFRMQLGHDYEASLFGLAFTAKAKASKR